MAMFLARLELTNFRNYSQKIFEFSDGINVIYGENGIGKTNLLESIGYLCLTRSFRTGHDVEIVQFGQTFFRLQGRLILDNSASKEVTLEYTPQQGKKIFWDGQRVPSVADHIGNFPVVILTPEDEEIASGPPGERRRFLDIVLSQLDRGYLKDLQDYRRVIKQRKAILETWKDSNPEGLRARLEPWDQGLFLYGRKIVEARRRFLQKFETALLPIFRALTSEREQLSLRYLCGVGDAYDDRESFQEVLRRMLPLELQRQTCLVGPHRDDLEITLDNRDLRRYGSRGQKRSVLIAMKIAEFLILRETKGEAPVFLLDDVYAEIDREREANLNRFFVDLGQVFITSNNFEIKIDSDITRYKEVRYCQLGGN